MSTVSTIAIREAIVSAISALKLVDDVRALPINHAQDTEFYNDMPDLKSTACLVIFKGWSDQDKKRRRRWSAVVVIRDVSGKGSDASLPIADSLAAALANKEITITESDVVVWITPNTDLALAASDVKFSVCELAFESLEPMVEA